MQDEQELEEFLELMWEQHEQDIREDESKNDNDENR